MQGHGLLQLTSEQVTFSDWLLEPFNTYVIGALSQDYLEKAKRPTPTKVASSGCVMVAHRAYVTRIRHVVWRVC